MGLFSKLSSALFGNSSNIRAVDIVQEKVSKELKKKQLQEQVDNMAMVANERLRDLEKNELTQSSAYAKWESGGKVTFGVKGKTYQEIQKEFWRIKNFLDSKTSTVEGARKVLADVSKLVGMDSVMSGAEASNYFKLADAIAEYYEMSGESARALDYQAIWEVIDKAVKNGIATLDENEWTVDEIQRIIMEVQALESEIIALEEMENQIVQGRGGIHSRSIFSRIASGISSFFRGFFR